MKKGIKMIYEKWAKKYKNKAVEILNQLANQKPYESR